MRAVAAEFVGTALLLAIVVGSGIMGARLCAGNLAIALLANSLATGAGLVALILTFGPVSGAHLNPAVSFAAALTGALAWRRVPGYVAAQAAGALAGVALAHAVFGLPMFEASTTERSGLSQALSEFIAAFALVATVLAVARTRPAAVPFAVGAVITAGYWFTASTSFANPAVTLARAATDTFAGVRLADVPGFVAAQLLGALAAVGLFAAVLRPRECA
jgi:glycerol uptake facilitator-like aquaporin